MGISGLDHPLVFCSSNSDGRDLPLRRFDREQQADRSGPLIARVGGQTGKGGLWEIPFAGCPVMAPGKLFLALGDSKSKSPPPIQSLHFQEIWLLSLHVSSNSQHDLNKCRRAVNLLLHWGCLFPVDKYCANVHFN